MPMFSFLRHNPIVAGPPQGHLTVPAGDPPAATPKPKCKAAPKIGSKIPKAKTAQQEATKVPRIYHEIMGTHSYVVSFPLNITYLLEGTSLTRSNSQSYDRPTQYIFWYPSEAMKDASTCILECKSWKTWLTDAGA